jgi:predicted ferric reductase
MTVTSPLKNRTIRNPLSRELLGVTRLSSHRIYLVAPTLALLSGATAFLAFPPSEDGAWLGLAWGGASLVFFAWSMILASRSRLVDQLFGGFDRVHLWHRLFSLLAVLTMWLHSQSDMDIAEPVTTFGQNAANVGYGLAELGEKLIIGLTLISIFKFVPYKWWKFSHTLFIVPYLFGAFHFLTSESTFVINSPWGIYFTGISVLGAIAFSFRLAAVDSGLLTRRFTVSSLQDLEGGGLGIRLTPATAHQTTPPRPGQFVFIDFPAVSREAHPFSVAGVNPDGSMDFYIEAAGDWTASLASTLHVGAYARVSRPWGSLNLKGSGKPERVWIAGGSGVAPFLSAEAVLADGIPTTLLYSYRDVSSAMGLDTLRRLVSHQNFQLIERETSRDGRVSPQDLQEFITPNTDVVVCGPEGMVQDVRKVAQKTGSSLEFELFDYRLAYGIPFKRWRARRKEASKQKREGAQLLPIR